jgi:hypothetical protein
MQLAPWRCAAAPTRGGIALFQAALYQRFGICRFRVCGALTIVHLRIFFVRCNFSES